MTAAKKVGAKGRVLLADDEPSLRRAYARILRDAGFSVETASDGNEALQLLEKTKFDVVVSDIGMPGIDGIDVLRRVRQHDLDVPVILVTGQPTVESAVRTVEHGALRYFLKPIDAKDLVASVDTGARLHRMAILKRQALSLADGRTSMEPGDRVGLDTRLDRALSTMWMAYQPIVSWRGRSLYAFEALLRTTDESLPHPGAVLEAAERLGRLHDVGRATRGQVAGKVEEAPAPLLFVNLHTHDLLDPTLYEPDSPLSKVARRIVLEITERATLDGVKDVRQRVGDLRALGFRVALDDLGSGYAGLTSFAHLEPDVVKLDMVLVRDMHLHQTKKKLVSSVVQLCQDMGIATIAEGVETPDERDALVECGCDLLQGYLFARPGRPFPGVDWLA